MIFAKIPILMSLVKTFQGILVRREETLLFQSDGEKQVK